MEALSGEMEEVLNGTVKVSACRLFFVFALACFAAITSSVRTSIWRQATGPAETSGITSPHLSKSH